MEVVRAKTAGFCMGVSLALRKLEKALDRRSRCAGGGRLYTFGPIIHNPRLIKEYEERGAFCLQDPLTAKPGDSVVIRAHGLPDAVENELLRGRGINVIDATCPKVKAAQMAIRKAYDAGHGKLLLFGEAEHPEVQGLLSYAGFGARVFGSLEDLSSIDLRAGGTYFLAAQTTQDKSIFTEAEKYVKGMLGHDVVVLQTICNATEERQSEVIRLADRVRSMVIVGGLNSGNTTRLADIARGLGLFTHHCENGNGMPVDQLRGLQPVGLSAGASTPDKQIDEIEKILTES